MISFVRRMIRNTRARTGSIRRVVAWGIGVVFAVLGLFIIFFGIVIGFLTPLLPIGFPIAIMGVFVLTRSPWGQDLMLRMLSRFPKIKKFIPRKVLNVLLNRVNKV